MFGYAVGDSTITDGDSLEFVITDKESFYKAAKDDASILTQGVPADAQFLSEYNSLEVSNIGKYEAVKDLIKDGDKLAALVNISNIADQNVIEENKKIVSSIISLDYDPYIDSDSDTVSTLNQIALMHPFYGGEAVYWARAILRLNVLDELLPYRKSRNIKQEFERSILSVSDKLYPNPATNDVTFVSHDHFDVGEVLEFYNEFNELICHYNLPKDASLFKFNVSNLNAGVILVRRIREGKIVSNEKLVIMK
jgi:hypothetical protein